jgi:hypothetical protein
MLQPRKRGSERPQDQFGAEAIVQIGRMDHDFEHEAFGVHQQVAFAPGNFLGAIKAMRATLFGGFDRLAIDDGLARPATTPLLASSPSAITLLDDPSTWRLSQRPPTTVGAVAA